MFFRENGRRGRRATEERGSETTLSVEMKLRKSISGMMKRLLVTERVVTIVNPHRNPSSEQAHRRSLQGALIVMKNPHMWLEKA